ncbi:MAG TPA: hypothetical protein VHE32_12245 [Rhodanobacteraceae bacterium]|nr:hypothetical protein [Rhodanobacteraceae bacterium]
MPRQQQRHGRIGADAIAKAVDQEKAGSAQQQNAGDGGDRPIEDVAALDVGVDIRSPCRDERDGAAADAARL